MVETEKKLSASNGRLLMYDIIDGKYPQDMSFKDIIDQDFAFDSEPIDYEQVVKSVLDANQKTVAKVIK